jgi:hypothetical protein
MDWNLGWSMVFPMIWNLGFHWNPCWIRTWDRAEIGTCVQARYLQRGGTRGVAGVPLWNGTWVGAGIGTWVQAGYL